MQLYLTAVVPFRSIILHFVFGLWPLTNRSVSFWIFFDIPLKKIREKSGKKNFLCCRTFLLPSPFYLSTSLNASRYLVTFWKESDPTVGNRCTTWLSRMINSQLQIIHRQILLHYDSHFWYFKYSSKGSEYFFHCWKSQVCIASHQYYWRQLSRSLKFCDGCKEPQPGPGGSRNGSVCTSQSEAERQLFVWPAMKSSSVFHLWCSQAWGQVSDRRSLCTALCPLPESYREAALCCYMEKPAGKRRCRGHYLSFSSCWN